jgi:hypothetical protein
MECPRCAAQNREERRFCAECGAPLAVPCPSCGFSNEPGEKFCGACTAQPTAAGRPVEAPGHLHADLTPPKHLAEKILTSKGALEGERQQVTVLFCDIVDSSRLAERLDPEAMHEMMDDALRLMPRRPLRGYGESVPRRWPDGPLRSARRPGGSRLPGGPRRRWRSARR